MNNNDYHFYLIIAFKQEITLEYSYNRPIVYYDLFPHLIIRETNSLIKIIPMVIYMFENTQFYSIVKNYKKSIKIVVWCVNVDIRLDPGGLDFG